MSKRHLWLLAGVVILAGGVWYYYKRQGKRVPWLPSMSNPAGVNNGVIAKPGAPDSIVPNPDASPYQSDRSDMDAAFAMN